MRKSCSTLWLTFIQISNDRGHNCLECGQNSGWFGGVNSVKALGDVVILFCLQSTCSGQVNAIGCDPVACNINSNHIHTQQLIV